MYATWVSELFPIPLQLHIPCIDKIYVGTELGASMVLAYSTTRSTTHHTIVLVLVRATIEIDTTETHVVLDASNQPEMQSRLWA